MTDNKIWLITGAGRGMGVDIAKAALTAGNIVVATGRNPETVVEAIGENDNLYAMKLDVTSEEDAAAVTKAVVNKFGSIDVLVNNAANFVAGFFEEIEPDDFRGQMETNFFGSVNVTRAILPTMREQRSGLVIQISSVAGFVGGEFCSAYAASKFALEGFMEALNTEVGQFGIKTMIVEPGYFRTELLSQESTNFAESSIDDYKKQSEETIANWQQMNGKQGGDPAKLANALVELAEKDEPPVRWLAGADAVGALERKANTLLEQAGAYRELSSSLDHDEA